MLTIASGAIALWGLLEIVSAWAIRVVYARYRITWSPAPQRRLSRACRAFIEEFVRRDGHGDVLSLHHDVGWCPRPGAVSRDGRIRINLDGARADRRYSREPTDGVGRVGVFGDCMSFGGDVANRHAWPAQLEQTGALDVLNFAVEAYGPGQMLDRYVDAQQHYAAFDVAVLAISTSNVYKPLNAFRPFYSFDNALALGKPSYHLADGELTRVDNPLPSLASYRELLRDTDRSLTRLAAIDRYATIAPTTSPFDRLPSIRLMRMLTHVHRRQRVVVRRDGTWVESSDAVRTTLALVDAFSDAARRRGTEPLVLSLPVPADFARVARHGRRPTAPLIRHCRRHDIEVLDALDVLLPSERSALERLFVGRHYSPEANRLIAGHVATASAIRRTRSNFCERETADKSARY